MQPEMFPNTSQNKWIPVAKQHHGFIILLTGNFLPSAHIRGFCKPLLSGWNEAVSLLAARNEPISGIGLLLYVSLSTTLLKAW